MEGVADPLDDPDEDTVWVAPPPPVNPGQVYEVKIPVDQLGKLRDLADQAGCQPAELLATWAQEHLKQGGSS